MIEDFTNDKFKELQQTVLSLLLEKGAFYKSKRNNKIFYCKKVNNIYSKIIQSLNKEEKDIYDSFFRLFNNEQEAFYCLRLGVSPFEHICSCGKFCKFDVSSNEYLKTCGNISCYQKLIHAAEVKEKIKQTCLERYGVDNPAKSKQIIEKAKQTILKRTEEENTEIIEKRRKTCLKKYGVNYIGQLEEAKEKAKQTCLEKYRASNPFGSKLIQSKIEQACLEKYGVSKVMRNKEISNKSKLNKQVNKIKIQEELNATPLSDLIIKYGNGWYLNRKVLNIEFIKYNNYNFVKNEDVYKIQKYSEENILNGSSMEEQSVKDFIESIYKGEIVENSRSIISPKELDIYIPDKKIAIEYDGLIWHSTCFKGDKNYHLSKTLACNKLGIRLLHIFSDEWKDKNQICKSLISSALGIYNQRIYARDCKVKEITQEEYKDFLEQNHIQGSVNSNLRLGLFYNNELVQIAGWGKSRFKSDELELHRMATKNFTQVIGGFSKLIKHSGLKHFYSYVDKRLFNGNGYISSGFKYVGESKPSYFYTQDGKTKFNRLIFQKHKLINILDNFDSNLSEEENMLNNNYYRVYDCGQMKFEYIGEKI